MLENILKVKIIKFKADLFNLQKRIAFYTILKMFFILLEYTKKIYFGTNNLEKNMNTNSYFKFV